MSDLRVIEGDCLEVLPTLAAGSVGCVCTDPPYGIPAGSAFVRRGGREVQDWGDVGHNVAVEGWLELVPWAENAVCLEFGQNGPGFVEEQIARHRAAGLTPWRFVILVKAAPPPTPRPTMVSAYEQALVSYRGKRMWFGSGYVPNVWRGNTPNRLGVANHPCEKPVEPLRMWLEALCPPGGTVLDPFLGSGTTLVACAQLGLNGLGIEREAEYCATAKARIAAATQQRRLALDT